jgi:TRAP-type C4-dicarboxylate transport system substrate-binding protein
MPEAEPLRIAGYQGEASILTASLRLLARGLEDGDCLPPIAFQADVTASGEKATELFASVEGGARQIAYMASSYLSARVPELAVLDLPFSVHDRAAALAALDGEAGALLREAVSRRTGLHVLGFWDNGFRHISNAVRPITAPPDCAGLVIRTLDSEQYRSLLAALGFEPVSLDVKNLVQAVANREVDAQENPLANLLAFELWRHHRYVSLTGHLFGVLLVVCPREWFERLQPRQRQWLQQAVDGATRDQRARAAGQDLTALEFLRARGVEVLRAGELDLAAFRRAAEPLARGLRVRLPADLLRAYLGA